MNHLSSILLVIFFILAIVLIIYAIKSLDASIVDENDEADKIWPFYLKQVFTRNERVLYHRLVSALPDRIVLAHVQVARILGVKKKFYNQQWINLLNRMTYDFVILSNDFSVLAVIELCDISNNDTNRILQSEKKEKATLATGTLFIRWNINHLPNEVSIQSAIAESPFS